MHRVRLLGGRNRVYSPDREWLGVGSRHSTNQYFSLIESGNALADTNPTKPVRPGAALSRPVLNGAKVCGLSARDFWNRPARDAPGLARWLEYPGR